MIDTEQSSPHYYTGNGKDYQEAEARATRHRGNLYREKFHWQLHAFIGDGVILLALCAVVFFAMRAGRIEPIYLTLNTEGQLEVLHWDAYNPSEEDIKKDLILWMRCARGIPLDRPTLERCWQLVPLFLLQHTQAFAAMQAYYAQLKPDKLLYQKSVDIPDAIRAFQHPDGRWQLDWTEDIYQMPKGGGLGKLESRTAQTAILIITRVKPKQRKAIELPNGERVNPRGIYITSLAWSEKR